MHNDFSQKLAVSDISFEKILHNRVLTAITCLLCLMTEGIINGVVCCPEYKRISFSINNRWAIDRSIQAVSYNPL